MFKKIIIISIFCCQFLYFLVEKKLTPNIKAYNQKILFYINISLMEYINNKIFRCRKQIKLKILAKEIRHTPLYCYSYKKLKE